TSASPPRAACVSAAGVPHSSEIFHASGTGRRAGAAGDGSGRGAVDEVRSPDRWEAAAGGVEDAAGRRGAARRARSGPPIEAAEDGRQAHAAEPPRPPA